MEQKKKRRRVPRYLRLAFFMKRHKCHECKVKTYLLFFHDMDRNCNCNYCPYKPVHEPQTKEELYRERKKLNQRNCRARKKTEEEERLALYRSEEDEDIDDERLDIYRDEAEDSSESDEDETAIQPRENQQAKATPDDVRSLLDEIRELFEGLQAGNSEDDEVTNGLIEDSIVDVRTTPCVRETDPMVLHWLKVFYSCDQGNESGGVSSSGTHVVNVASESFPSEVTPALPSREASSGIGHVSVPEHNYYSVDKVSPAVREELNYYVSRYKDAEQRALGMLRNILKLDTGDASIVDVLAVFVYTPGVATSRLMEQLGIACYYRNRFREKIEELGMIERPGHKNYRVALEHLKHVMMRNFLAFSKT